MTTPPPAARQKVELLLGNLAKGLLPDRLDAIKELAALDFSSMDIVVALMQAREHDINSMVRGAAAQALHVPVHQIFWQEHSDAIASMLAEEQTRLSPLSWYQAWSMAVFHPSVKTFEQIALNARATRMTAFRWMWISNVPVPVIGVVIGTIRALPQGTTPWYDLAPYPVYCLIQSAGLAIGVAIPTLVVMMGIGIWHIIARLFRGKGTYVGLLNAVAAFIAPLTLTTGLIGLASVLSAIPELLLLSILLQIYMLVLFVIAVKSVYRFGWVQAVAANILSFLLIALMILLVAVMTGLIHI
jgi:hypothetical protein